MNSAITVAVITVLCGKTDMFLLADFLLALPFTSSGPTMQSQRQQILKAAVLCFGCVQPSLQVCRGLLEMAAPSSHVQGVCSIYWRPCTVLWSCVSEVGASKACTAAGLSREAEEKALAALQP